MFEEYGKYIVVNTIVVCIKRIFVFCFEERTFVNHYLIRISNNFIMHIRHNKNQLYTNLSYQSNCKKYFQGWPNF